MLRCREMTRCARKRTYAVQQGKTLLFDDLAGGGEERRRNVNFKSTLPLLKYRVGPQHD
jgi:hypothetical protein